MKQNSELQNAMRAWNYKLFLLCVVVENSFGRLKGRWRILKFPPFFPDVSADVSEAAMALHNFLEQRKSNDVLPVWIAEVEEEERFLNSLAEVAGQQKLESLFEEDGDLSSTGY